MFTMRSDTSSDFSARNGVTNFFHNKNERYCISMQCPRGYYKGRKYSDDKTELENYFYETSSVAIGSKAQIFDKTHSTSSSLYSLTKTQSQVLARQFAE